MITTKHHTIRVRFKTSSHTHQAIDDRSNVKCTSTSGHEQAARRLLEKQGLTGQLFRAHHLEKGLYNSSTHSWEQWRVYIVEPVTA